MTALGAALSARDRDRLAARLRELEKTGRLLTERGQQRPPPVPPALPELARNVTRCGQETPLGFRQETP